MDFRTPVALPSPSFHISPMERMLFVGSCFADNIGRRFQEERFHAVVNPYGVMYNPASILHTVRQYTDSLPQVAVLTLGTNHVYRLKATGEIVDNCQKRPQSLFTEEELSVSECADCLTGAVDLLLQRNHKVHVVLTVSPIRYAKYGFHGSQLSKATLLLAADEVVRRFPGVADYFPAYEIVNDELRDYRFYAPDMLHPSAQAVEYIYERFAATYFSKEAHEFIAAWRPVKEAVAHRPLHPDSDAYRRFVADTREKARQLLHRYPTLDLSDVLLDGRSLQEEK